MYTIRSAGPNKGLGVFATALIPRGTRILSEAPLLSVPSRDGQSRPADLFAAFHRTLSKEEQRSVLDLSSYPGAGIGRIGRWASALLWTLRQKKTSGREGTARGFCARFGRNKRVLDIWRSNSFDIPAALLASSSITTGAHSLEPCAPSSSSPPSSSSSSSSSSSTFHLFPTIARLNHSCIPNAQANFLFSSSSCSSSSSPSSPSSPCTAPSQGTFNVHALRDIPAGTEIHLSYLGEHGALRAARREKLKVGYGFVCECPACDDSRETGKAAEERRLEMQGRMARFAAGRDGGGSREQGVGAEDFFYDSEGNRIVVGTPAPMEELTRGPEAIREGELEITLEYIKMLEEQSVSGREVATIYYSVSRMLQARGRTKEAFEKAEKGLQIDADCLGRDHPIYRNMEAYVQSLRV